MTNGNMHFNGNENTHVNTNRFGAQQSGTSDKVSVSKANASHSLTSVGGKVQMQGKAPVRGKPVVKASASVAGKTDKKSVSKSIGNDSQKSVRFGASPGQAKTASADGFKQNTNPFKHAVTQHPYGYLRKNTPSPIHSASHTRIDSAFGQPETKIAVNPEFSMEDGDNNG